MLASTRICRSVEFLEAQVDGELVALHVDKGTCYGFNSSATRIWGLLAEPLTLDELCAALIAEYEVDRETCEREVTTVLRELESDSLVRIEGDLG